MSLPVCCIAILEVAHININLIYFTYYCKGSCFSEFFGGGCSGTPPECLDCNKAIECERNSSLSTGGDVLTKHAGGGYGYEYVDYNQPPSVNYKCPIGKRTP